MGKFTALNSFIINKKNEDIEEPSILFKKKNNKRNQMTKLKHMKIKMK